MTRSHIAKRFPRLDLTSSESGRSAKKLAAYVATGSLHEERTCQPFVNQPLEYFNVDPELDRVIDEVEKESEAMCEACGAPAKTSISEHHWFYTFCETHMPDGARYIDDVYPPPPTSS